MQNRDQCKLHEIEQKMQQLKAKKQKLEAQIRQKERKERTRRLIQIGAIFEKWCDIQGESEAEALAKAISKNAKEWLAGWREKK